MNYVDLTLILFAVISAYVGFRRGFLLSFLAMARTVLGIPVSLWAGKTYSAQIYDSYVRDYIFQQVSDRISDSAAISEITSSLKETVNAFSFLLDGKADLSEINSLTPQTAAVYITDNVIGPIALEIVKIVLIVLTFLIFYVITGIIISLIKKIREKKKMPLHFTNSVLGCIFGLAKAVVIIFAISAVAEFTVDIQYEDNAFIRQLESSVILNFFSDFNSIIAI